MLKEHIQDVSALGGNAIFFAFAFIFLITSNLKEFWTLAVAFIIAYLLTAIIRFVWWTERPDREKYYNVWGKFDSGSFPSMHAMRATILAVVLMVFYQNIWATITFSAAVAAVCLARVWLKRHRLVDIVAGVIFGLIISWIAPQIINALGIL